MKKLSLLTILASAALLAPPAFAASPLQAAKAAGALLDKPGLKYAGDSYYVFEGRSRGFAIVDLDGNILGYSDTSAAEAGDQAMPPAMQYLIGKSSASAHSAPKRSPMYAPRLIKTPSFDQSKPFNNNIANNYVVGCTGVAMATVMKYHNWPPKGRDVVEYNGYRFDYANTTFDWDNILDSYSGSYTATQAKAVSELCYAAAVSVHTDFGTSTSGAYSSKICEGLLQNFYYSPGMYIYPASAMTPAKWEAALRAEIDAGRPVIYCGSSQDDSFPYLDSAIGHAFVVDGYDDKGLFHINWGWGGRYDGYFALTALSPNANSDFSKGAQAVFGIEPDREMKDRDRVVVFLSEYQPEHLDGMTSDVPQVTVQYGAEIANFCWRVNGEPFKSLSTAVALCDASGKVLSVGRGTELDEWSLGIQLEGFQGHTLFYPKSDAREGDYLCAVYKGDNMTEWKKMGEEGPVRNYCPAYGYEVPKIPVKWINAENFTITPLFDVRGLKNYTDYIVAGHDWSIKIKPKSDVAYYQIQIDGKQNHPLFYTVYYAENSETHLFGRKGTRYGESYEIEIESISHDEVNDRLVTLTDVKPGTLESRLNEVVSPRELTGLKVQGRLTDTDFYFIREKMHMITELDLTDVSIAKHDYNPEDFLPYKALENKHNLQKLILPEKLVGFHNNSLSSSSISSIYIPSCARQFGLNVFNSCRSLKHVTIAQNEPPQISWCVFSGTPRPEATLVVPLGCREKYAVHEEWGQFGTIIEDPTVVDGILPVIAETDGGIFFVTGNTVTAPCGCTVYDVCGRIVGSGTSVTLPAKGIYIVKCGERSSKIAL